MSPAEPIEQLADRIRAGRSFLLTSHTNPDGDAIGSSIGFARALRALGKSTVVWSRDPAPADFAELVAGEPFHFGEAPPPGFPDRFDTAIVLECPSLDRTGLEEPISTLPMLNIDHHLGNEGYGEIQWVDPSAASVGELVFQLLQALGAEIDSRTATALYLTLVTDTGGFRFSNTTARAFETAGALARLGASPETVTRWLYESRPLSAMRLLGEVLPTIEVHAAGRIATAWLHQDMWERSGAAPGDSEGLIDYPRSIAGVEAVALFRQLPDGNHKVSLRSRGDLDVEQIARRRGGGGHKNAAGFSSEAPRDTLFRETVQSLIQHLE